MQDPRPGCLVRFRCPVSSGSSWLWQFLKRPSFWCPWQLCRVLVRCFVECSPSPYRDLSHAFLMSRPGLWVLEGRTTEEERHLHQGTCHPQDLALVRLLRTDHLDKVEMGFTPIMLLLTPFPDCSPHSLHEAIHTLLPWEQNIYIHDLEFFLHGRFLYSPPFIYLFSHLTYTSMGSWIFVSCFGF